jgi:multiphosphoryl transfer protein
MPERTLRTGAALHARPLDRFVRRARAVSGSVRLRYGAKEADGRNVTQLLLLAVPRGAEVTLTVESGDEETALRELGELLEQTEEQPAQPPPPVVPTIAGVVAGSPGRGVGRAHRPGRVALRRAAGPVAEEQQRLERALQVAREATRCLIRDEDPFSDIFEVQLTLLDDPALFEALHRAVGECGGVEHALDAVFGELAARFRSLGSAFAAERHADLADVHDRLLAALGLGELEASSDARLVLILEEATPSRLALLDTARVAAVISEQGGPTSHAAVVARGRGVPLVFAPPSALADVVEGELLLVDGSRGAVRRAAPAEATGGAVAATPERVAAGALTRDGVRVCLRANLGAPGDLGAALRWGAEGCGLLRTELLFAGREQAPAPEEHARAYERLARALAPHPLVVRLFDAGSDKPLAFLPGPADEPNPALGRRGVRLLLAHPRVLADQLLGIAEARRTTGGEVRAMVPMINDAAELEAVRDLCPPELPLGTMIETPAAAILCRELAAHAAFLSVGSNDLAQYVTASDRQRGESLLHPAVLRLLADIAQQAADSGVECSVCGELAGDPRTAPLLVGVGYRCLSVPPAQLAAVRRAVGARSLAELAELARAALAHTDGAALAVWLQLQAPAGEEP